MAAAKKKTRWSGDVGSSVFTEPFIDHEARPNQLPGFLQRIESTGDDRSFVIVSAVVVERYLDALLGAFIPKYNLLTEKREFTFSLKLDLLSAMRLIPPHILQLADVIRQVRNEFAHELDCNRLDELNSGLQSSMAQRTRDFYGEGDPHSSSPRMMFKGLTFAALAGFEIYRTNLSILREKMDDGILAAALGKECHERFMARIAAMKDRGPVKVEEREGWRYKYYDGGLVDISPVDPNNPPATVNLDAKLL